MKTNLAKIANWNVAFRMFFILVVSLTTFHTAIGQQKRIWDHDYLLPAKGKSMLDFYTGVPYVAVGQYSYGFSHRFSAGVFYGHTPINKGFGLKVKAVLAEPSASFRINLKSTFIYYPHMEYGEGDAWVLGWPAVNTEWKLNNGSRFWTGVGVVGVSCVDMLLKPKEKKSMPSSDGPVVEGKEMKGVWNTFQFGYSKPISNHSSFLIEVAPIMEGFRLKSKSGFLDAFPVIITTGLSYSF